ncbi:3-methyl-2-oxobutanoate dehydrogenase subunit VorB [uncultured Dysosmobacter sp.]|uniref:3-methyl-2-oxobutanoate dehydrogenase subunit VorB n=1 Tax=uncultured Dysosmobacter sp. TaxID=2591384 RepID=UPI00261329B6|nr:3-methyl-2-oxobutanoate dehydrogenase subunit VorB [uncultured Dysosmobacter sp.]
MSRAFVKGGDAIAEAAIRAGCRFFAGYPITPQNEIPEYFAKHLPEAGGSFVQGESETASINMVFGASLSGTRCMTSSSSCGISLKSEGFSYLAAARLPSVICSVQRGGPGYGSIKPAQSDYLQATKAAGNGGFKMIVFAPSTVQETIDHIYEAFDYADKYRNPTMVLLDGVISTMMEPVVFPEPLTEEQVQAIKDSKTWALNGKKAGDKKKLITGGATEQSNMECAEMYEYWAEHETRAEEYLVEDAEFILTAYGTTARVARAVVDTLRKEGIRAGLIRPILVNPFPYKSFAKLDYSKVKCVIDLEMTIPAQMIEDVKLGVLGKAPIRTVLRSCGEVMTDDFALGGVKKIIEEY